MMRVLLIMLIALSGCGGHPTAGDLYEVANKEICGTFERKISGTYLIRDLKTGKLHSEHYSLVLRVDSCPTHK